MREARDFAGLSFPFAAGVAASAFLPLHLFPFALPLLPAPVLLMTDRRLRRYFRISAPIVFFLLGVLCFALSNLPGPDIPVPAFAGRAMEYFDSLMEKSGFRENTSALLRALLTGRRDALSPGVAASFRAAGASHILALSGLHLGIIYLIISKLLAFLGRSRPAAVLRSVAVVAACAGFTLVTGACPSMVRALIFIVFAELLRHNPGRSRDPLLIWCAALMIQLAINPQVIGSTGFQLSYLAMLGISLVFPVLDGWYPPSRGPLRKIWSSMALSISAQAFTAPLVWVRFGTFPVYFLVTNLLAMPLTSALMACAIASLALSAFGLDANIAARATDAIAAALTGTLDIIAGL